jgi:hypothetical protein
MACLESPLISEKRREPQQRFLLMGQVAGKMVLGTFAETKVPRRAGARPRIKINHRGAIQTKNLRQTQAFGF